jgi:hypothetical protein
MLLLCVGAIQQSLILAAARNAVSHTYNAYDTSSLWPTATCTCTPSTHTHMRASANWYITSSQLAKLALHFTTVLAMR